MSVQDQTETVTLLTMVYVFFSCCLPANRSLGFLIYTSPSEIHKRCGAFAPPWIFCDFVQNFTEGDMTNYRQSQFVLEEGIIKKNRIGTHKKKVKGGWGKEWACDLFEYVTLQRQRYQDETGRLITHTAGLLIQGKGRTQKLIWPVQ